MKKGDCIFVNSETLHQAISVGGEPAIVFVVVFSPDLFYQDQASIVYQKYFRLFMESAVPGFVIDQNVAFGEQVIDDLQRILNLSTFSSMYELQCIGAISNLWSDVFQYGEANHGEEIKKKAPVGSSEKRLKVMTDYIRKHYDQGISVETLAEVAHISRSECYRTFKSIVGKSPIEYINEFRLVQSTRMLTTTCDPITTISFSCGFCTSSYYSQLFKEAYGMTPSAYREEYYTE